MLIATCDRIELASHDERAVAAFAPLVAAHTGVAPDAIAAALYRHEDEAALRHLFALSSALASSVIGEPHVLGQVRAAHRTASELGAFASAPALESAFPGAPSPCARRVRRETGIAAQPVSIAAAALDRARDIHGDLDRCTALLLGPAEMGEMMAERLRGGVRRVSSCVVRPSAPSAPRRGFNATMRRSRSWAMRSRVRTSSFPRWAPGAWC